MTVKKSHKGQMLNVNHYISFIEKKADAASFALFVYFMTRLNIDNLHNGTLLKIDNICIS